MLFKKGFSVFLVAVLLAQAFFVALEVSGQDEPVTGWVNRQSFVRDNGDGSYTWMGSVGPQVFWDSASNSFQELEFVKNDTYPYFITWASVANTTYFVRNSHIALEITNNSYVKLWNPDYTSVSVYNERWTVEVWQANKWKDTGVGAQANGWSVVQDSDSVNITRSQSLVGVGQLKLTYIVRKGAYLKHEVAFTSFGSDAAIYRVVMNWAGIPRSSKVKTDSEEFMVAGEVHKVPSFFLVGQDSSSMVVQEYLESVYPYLSEVVFNTHAQGIKADVILGNWTLDQNDQLTFDPDTSTFDVVSDDYDGRVYASNTNYATVHDATTGTASSTSFYTTGQVFETPDYYVRRAFVRFNTTTLTSEATISAAELCLGVETKSGTQDFVVRLQKWTEASDGLSVADYDGFDGVNYDDGLKTFNSLTNDVYGNVTVSNFELINKVGYTDICVRSSREINSDVPTTYESVEWLNTGELKPSLLKVTYTTVVPEYDYVDSQTDLDSHADHGTHSSFAAQKATDWTNDTLTEANTNTTVLDNSENFVDNNSSDVDSHANHGLSTNFTGQQDSNVLYNDTLTEANTAGTTSNVFTDGFEDGTFNKWDGNGATTWGDGATFMATNSSPGAPWVTHSGTYMADADSNDDGNLTSDSINAAAMQAIGISFWYMNDDGDGDDFYFFAFDGANWDIITALGDSGTTNEDVWLRYTWVTTDSQYFEATFHFGFTAGFGSNEGGFIDDVVVNMTINNNYELDMEFQWTTADYDETSEYVCIRTGSTFGAENILVKYRNGGTWNTLVTLTTVNTWYNTTIAITSETLTLQFLGATETSDTTQSTWQIECSLIHVWSYGLNYELDLEEQFTSANFSRTSEELCIRMGAMNGETLSVQWWNTTASSWLTIIASLSTNVWNNVSVTTYLTSATFTIKFIDGTKTSDEAQGTWDKDACLLHTSDVANANPSITDLRLSLISDTVNITTGITVNTWYDWEVSVSDADTLNDIATLTIRVANNPSLTIDADSASYNESSVYWFRYTNTTDAWEWYSGASWTATSDWIDGNCTNPTKTESSGYYLFRVQLSKVARYSSSWQFAALVSDSASNTANKAFDDISIAKYDELVMITTTHTWTNINIGGINVLVDEGAILFNVSCNYNFKLQAQSNSSWVESGDGYKIGIGNITIHKDTLGSAVPLTVAYADIGGLTDLNTLTANTQYSFKLWATIPEDTAYDKTYAYKCQVQTEDA